MDVMRGAYDDVGKAALLLGEVGEPSPYIPAAYLLEGESCRLTDTGGDILFCPWKMFDEEAEDCNPEGGVSEPTVELSVEVDCVVGTVLSLALLDSVDLSVRKLARDRRRRSFRKEGAMMTWKGNVSIRLIRCSAIELEEHTWDVDEQSPPPSLLLRFI
jgi:hypothetical protein